MNPGRVLVFLGKHKKLANTYYPVYKNAAILPVTAGKVQWPKDNMYAKVEPTFLNNVFDDIKIMQKKLIAKK